MPSGIRGYLRYRVVNRFDAGNSEVTNNLPHTASTWKVAALQPGNPSSGALGEFTITLPEPGSAEFMANLALILGLKRYQRIEGYLGYDVDVAGIGLSAASMKFAGLITGITITDDPQPKTELRGVTDLGLWNMYRPFPGELLANLVTTSLIKEFMGSNELGWSDTFNPFTAGNYVSTNTPAHTAGTWSGTTDDGLNVAACSSGTGAALLSKNGVQYNDGPFTMYAEAQVRLNPSADANSAGQTGLGFSNSNANCSTSVVAYVEAFKSLSGRYGLNAKFAVYSAGSLINSGSLPGVLADVDDPSGMIPLTIGILISDSGNATNSAQVTLVVNGSPVFGQQLTSYPGGAGIQYPFLFFGNPATGTATTNMTNLVQFMRFTADANPATAAVIAGTFGTSTNSVGYGVDPGPSFLDLWTRLQNREGWWLRYTPRPYVVGARTLGTLDFALEPGVDRSAGSSAGPNVIFSRSKGNLERLTIEDNADLYASGVEAIGQSTLDGGGLSSWHDIATLVSVGVIDDQMLSFTASDFNTQRAAARRIMSNKTAIGSAGSKTAVVVRDESTADVWTLLDKVTIDAPDFGLNNLTARIIAREFTEGSPTERITLDQFSWHGSELAS